MSDKAWYEPGVEEVLDGVYRIPLPLPNDGLRAVNVYAVSEGDRVTLIDSGWARTESLSALERGLADLGHRLVDIEQFLVTHAHSDHYAQAVTVRRTFGTPVSLGAGERHTIETLTNPKHKPLDALQARLELAGAHELIPDLLAWRSKLSEDDFRTQWEFPDRWLEPGIVSLKSRDLEVVATPGHTTGHVVFHDLAAAAMFTGDHVLPRITPSIGMEPGGGSLPLAAYLDSLRIVLERPDARLLPAHGPVTDSTHARAEELLAHHERRLALTAAAVDAGAHTAYEVAQVLRWTRRERPLAELDFFNRSLAIGETRVHLDVCVARGWMRSTLGSDGVLRYERA